ncbi:MAG: copper chaperone PCu(A)C [Proteobacteria bacterium]|nr:copper chaperone PCu(A)C [Pseudomonadota bacterium]
MKKATLLIAAIAVASLFPAARSFAAGDTKAGNITISAPWARATFAKAKTAAAYMTLNNSGDKADTLIGVKSAIAQKTGIHRTTMENGIMKMGAVGSIEVPAGGMAMLKPGGHHVMFMGLVQPLKEGANFPLTLVFAKASEVTVTVQILKPGAMGGAAMRHQH